MNLKSQVSTRITPILIVATDVLGVLVSFTIAYYLRKFLPFFSPLAHGSEIYLASWPAILLWPLLFWRDGLYRGFRLSAREELRRVVSNSTFAGLIVMTSTFLTQTGIQYSRPIVVGGWLASIFLLPAFRFMLRRLFCQIGIAGPTAIILGAGKTAKIILEGLKRQKPSALTPIAVFNDRKEKIDTTIEGVPVVGTLNEVDEWIKDRRVNTLVVAMPGIPGKKLGSIIDEHGKMFAHIIVVPDLIGLAAGETDTLDLQGIIALELRRNLLIRSNLIVKRAIDLLLVALSSIVVLPLLGIIALVVCVDSGFPPFFGQERIGHGGRLFKAWKFRTMKTLAGESLSMIWDHAGDLKSEWESSRKLKKDPRVTKTGKVLRRLSLDELPQFLNVIKGEMSLVGPRPIIEEEIPKYGDSFKLYTQVRPGLTGLWQVSGRSNLPYRDRVWLDSHYVRNWSIWLDIVIMVRTVWVVIAGIGAY